MIDNGQPVPNDPHRPNNTPVYAMVILLMTLIGIAGSVAVVLARPHEDNTSLIVTLLGFCAAATTSLLGFLRTEQNGNAISGVHKELNSRLSEWMAQQRENAVQAAKAAYVTGREDQRAETTAAMVVLDQTKPKLP